MYSSWRSGAGRVRMATATVIEESGRVPHHWSFLTGEGRGQKKSALSNVSSNASRGTGGDVTVFFSESVQKTYPQICQPSLLPASVKEGILDRKMECVARLLGSTTEATFYESFSLKNPQGFFSYLGHSKLTVAIENKELQKAVHRDDKGSVQANSCHPYDPSPGSLPTLYQNDLFVGSFVHLQHHFPSR